VTEEDDRYVVDARPAVGRCHRHLAANRPEDPQVDLVHRQAVTGCDREADRRGGRGEFSQPGRITGAGAAHPGFEHPADVVALEEQGESGDVILVWVRQDQGVDASVPRRDAAVERDEEPVGIGTSVDQQPTAARALDEDRVALSDIEDRHARRSGGTRRDDAARDRDGHDQSRDRGSARAAAGVVSGVPYGVGCRRRGRSNRSLDRRMDTSPTAPPGDRHETQRGDPGRNDVERRRQRDARERKTGRGLDHEHEDAQDHPSWRGDHRSEHGWRPGRQDHSAGQREDARRHRRGDQRDDDEVHEG